MASEVVAGTGPYNWGGYSLPAGELNVQFLVLFFRCSMFDLFNHF
jgi:hypothetical protein